MKKSLRLKFMLLLFAMVVGFSSAWAAPTFYAYTGGVQQASTTINSSNVSVGEVGVISWSGTNCSWGSSRINIAANGSIEFTALPGYNITKIVIYSASSGYYGNWSSSPEVTPTISGGTTTFDGLSANSVTVTTSSACRLTSTGYIQIHYESSSSPVTAPTLPATANFDANMDVTITPASGTDVWYTNDNSEPGNTNPNSIHIGEVTTTFNIKATTTVKAIAYDGMGNSSSVVSRTYTKTTSNISQVTTSGSSYTVVGTVVAVSNNGFVIGDGTGYVYSYISSHGKSVGDKVKITNSQLYNYNNVLEFKVKGTSASLSNYESGTATPIGGTEIESYASGNHLSDYVQVEGTFTASTATVEISGYNTRKAKVSYPTSAQTTSLSSYDGKKVRLRGFFTGFAGTTATSDFTIMYESIEDITPVVSVSPTSLSDFTYNYGSGPSAAQTITVGGSNLTADITVSANDNYVVSTDNSSYGSSVTLTQSSGSVGNTVVYVKLKAGLNSGTYNSESDKITVSSTGATSKTVALSGSVTHAITKGTPSNGTLTVASAAAYGETVTITAEPASGYKLASWEITQTTGGASTGVTPVSVGGNDYTITMPDFDITVNATFVQAFTITVTNTTLSGGSVYTTPTSAEAGEDVEITVTPNAGYALNSLVVKDSGDNDVTVTDNVFEMPASNVTITVSFIALYTVTYDKNGEDVTGSAPTDPSNPYRSGATVTVLGKGDLAWEGHTFDSWNTKSDGTGDVDYVAGSTFNISANITLYAQWTVNTHTVTLPNNDTYGNYTMDKSNPVAYGTEVTLTYTPASGYENYKATWNMNGTPFEGNKFTMPDSDVTITVSVTEITQASYIFNTDAGLSALSISKPNSNAGTDLGDDTYSVGLVDMTCTDGSTHTRVWNSSGTLTLRVYNGGTITFEVPSTPVAYVITKVEFGGTVNLTYGSNPATAVSEKTWEGQASSITFTNTSSSSQLTTITVTYARLRTLSFWVNGTEASTLEMGVANGKAIGTLPTTPSGIPSGYTFDGWMDATSSNDYYGSTAPAMVTTSTVVSGDMLLAAVFHETSTSSNYTTSIVTFYDDVVVDDLYGINYISGTVLASSFENHGLLVINDGGILEMDDDQDFTNTNPADLIIEDGGQLILDNSNTDVKATVKKTISAVPSSKDVTNKGWHSISSPVNNASVEDNTNLVTASAYDLYMFDESEENLQWINYNQANSTHGFTNMTNGRGYIYRNEAAVTATYTGTVNAADVECSVTKTENTPFSGFNLVGNPYTQKIKLANTQLLNGTAPLDVENQLVGYYVADIDGGWGTQLGADDEIDPAQGFLVQVPEDATKIKFSTTKFRSRANGDNIMFRVENSEYSDVTYALFDKGYGLSKINHRNGEIPMLYIPQNGEDYAIAMMSDDTKAFNLNFKAMTTGKYTLSYKAKGEFSYLHVIDRLTGEDVDMLLDGEYEFMASKNDNANRFIVKLEYSENPESSEDDIFAYQSGSDIVVTGDGELQIFDVMGRMVSAQHVNGVETVNVKSQGVYIMKLNEKTQKIVIR